MYFLLAINPSFWMFSHEGAHVQTNMMVDIMGSLFFFLLFYRTQRRPYLILATFLLGNGVYVLFLCVYQFLIIFTPSALNYAVFAFIPPYIALALALELYLFYEILSSSRFHKLPWMAILGMTLLGYSEVATLSSQYMAVSTTGGWGLGQV